MARTAFCEVDNRNPEHMFEYLEARIEFMKRRILELQMENEALRVRTPACQHVQDISMALVGHAGRAGASNR